MTWWSQPLRIEQPDSPMLCTARTVNSALWFINNPKLEYRILSYLAKYQQKYEVVLYGFVLQGNHYHLVAKFPRSNRSAFFRDLNARIAEAVRELVPQYLGGPLLERRYTPQTLPLASDLENYFFYCALQPVRAGLTKRISDYPSYNSFADAIRGRKRSFKILNKAKYNAAKRKRSDVSLKDFIETYALEYSRLPGYQDLSPAAYKTLMLKRLERERVELICKNQKEGKVYPSPERLRNMVPGTLPHSTKKGGWRPLVLTKCRETRKRFLEWYMCIVKSYREASLRYRRGDPSSEFPPGTYKPPGPLIPLAV